MRANVDDTMTAAAFEHLSGQKDTSRWEQVLARDARADGEFVYAVRTTGIFCRPSCPSRRPAARNVAFFATVAEARAAGFRACLRCRPEHVGDARGNMVARAAQVLAGEVDGRTTLADLARQTGNGRLAVMRGFRHVLGVTPGEFARAKKVARLRETLQGAAAGTVSKAGSITEAIYAAGFGSASRMYERSAKELGMTPGAMQRGGAGLTIRYAMADSPLGRMLVAATNVGVCAILFGDADAELEADLRRRFRAATLLRSKAADGWLADAVAYVASQTTEHPLAATFPLDVRATAFQQRVWKALQEIPRGETCSYTDVARAVGRPDAVRAVGAAIGANPLALVVPCHRVLGKDGSMTGYRWGLDRKHRLLDAEGRPQPRR